MATFEFDANTPFETVKTDYSCHAAALEKKNVLFVQCMINFLVSGKLLREKRSQDVDDDDDKP